MRQVEVSRTSQSDRGAASGVTGHVRALLESGAAASAAPAKQMRVLADTIRQHRAQIKTLQQQLFDDQLDLLENSLAPMLAWSEQWIKPEQAMLDMLGPPPGDDLPQR